ncbi:hypothetical protein ACFZAR_31325 [Streptomyces sp. NPDC008222]|uniref:Lsr2 family DNA-binding protein n=1 Tax=Streptomyces sp. NPDC008222 TaxID=3364820 RepID=UPI0036F0E444
MFTDMKEALEAEALELTPLGSDQDTAASVVVAQHALDKGDLADLLGALGLPCAEDDLVRLLPHLTSPYTPTGDSMTVNAFTVTAASMLNNGDSPEHVRSTLGLSDGELAEAVKHAAPHSPTTASDTDDSTSSPQAAAPASDGTADTDGIEALLSWAENHPTASIRNRATRVRSDLTELTERRATDAAQREAEERVAKAKAELEAAQAQLRTAKAGGRPATEVQDVTALSCAPAATQPGKRSKEELAAIRTWARAKGHQVADRGTPGQGRHGRLRRRPPHHRPGRGELMDAIPLALDGYLAAEPEPGDREGTATWRLNCSAGTDHLVEEAVIPCTTMEPEIAHALLTERQPGDLLRVIGHLTLPDTADGVMRLYAEAFEVLLEAPVLDTDGDDADTATATDTDAVRNSAIAALAEALTGFGQAAPGPGPSIRIHISPTGALGSGLEQCHSFDVTPAMAHRLADYVDAMNCYLDSERPDGVVLDPETIADLTELFEDIDLIGLTNTVLNATRPEHRPAVTQALDDMFGDTPVPGVEDSDP